MFSDRRIPTATPFRNPQESLNNPEPPHSADQHYHFQPSSTPWIEWGRVEAAKEFPTWTIARLH